MGPAPAAHWRSANKAAEEDAGLGAPATCRRAPNRRAKVGAGRSLCFASPSAPPVFVGNFVGNFVGERRLDKVSDKVSDKENFSEGGAGQIPAGCRRSQP